MRKIILMMIMMVAPLLRAQQCPDIIPVLITDSCPDALYVELFIPDFMGYTEVEVQVVEQNSNYNEFFVFVAGVSETNTFGPFLPTGVDLFISATFYSPTDPCFSDFGFKFYGCPGVDNDEDGVEADTDCNDNDPSIYPGATEICDGKDNDCDGQIDEGLKTIYYADQDVDGYPHPTLRALLCAPQSPYTISINDVTVSDCDDLDGSVYPDAPELCDEKDNNCDTVIDEGCSCPDNDGDGVCDADDNCPSTANTDQADGDSDGVGDVCDNCPSIANADQTDTDGNGTGDACETCPDADADGVCDADDNCPSTPNVDQADGDSDGVGDACDNCLTNSNADQADFDGDLVGDACDNCLSDGNASQTDTDADSVGDSCDNCPSIANSDQSDSNGNGVGDACEACPDADADGVCDADDNCPSTANADQADGDSDEVGDVCDNCPSLTNSSQEPDADCDGVLTSEDCNDNDPSITLVIGADTDNDGVPDCSDAELNSPCPSSVDNRGVSLDSDNDGVLDCNDGCPNDRLKTSSGECGCGISEGDTDGDGIKDCFDLQVRSKCLIVDGNGVSKDSDGDGVLDCDDACPGKDDRLDADNDKIPDGCDDYINNRGVPICHIGRNGVAKTLYVSERQIQRHLDHGDQTGVCTSTTAQVMSEDTSSLSAEQVVLYPNPASQELNVQVNSSLSSGAVLSVHDFNGNVFMQIPLNGAGVYTLELDNRFISGMYFIKINNGVDEVVKQFVIKQ